MEVTFYAAFFIAIVWLTLRYGWYFKSVLLTWIILILAAMIPPSSNVEGSGFAVIGALTLGWLFAFPPIIVAALLKIIFPRLAKEPTNHVEQPASR
jgi:hypothetical protein